MVDATGATRGREKSQRGRSATVDAHQDEEQPARFDVGRSPNPHLAFGGGPHFCLGAHLSRLESRVAFEQLVGELGELELACAPDELPWCAWRGGLRGLDRLPLRVRG